MLRRGFIYFYILFLSSLLSAWAVYHAYEGEGRLFGNKLTQIIKSYASIPSKIYEFFVTKNSTTSPLLIKDDKSKSGFQFLSDSSKNAGAILVSTFSNDQKGYEIKLLSLIDTSVLLHWYIQRETIKKINNGFDFDRLRLGHPLLLSDHSIIATVGDNSGLLYLFRIDSVGRVMWSNADSAHHSIELGNANDIWVASSAKSSTNLTVDKNVVFSDDAICNIDIATGKTMYKKSVGDILIENGYAYLLALGTMEPDPIHLNDVQPALYSSPFWEKGDLLISMRNRNTVFLYRPGTNKIIWLKTGPWANQHDVNFIGNNKILVFGNDVVRKKNEMFLLNGMNNAYVFDFETGIVSTPYTSLFKNEEIKTKTEGRCNILDNNDIFVDETDNGRVFIGDTAHAKLTYTDRFDNKSIKLLNWVRFLSAKELTSLNLNK